MKKALLVGINAYPNSPLRGCLRDVEQIHDLLIGTYGFHKEDIMILRDDKATLKGMEQGLAWLAERGKTSSNKDVRVFHYSGHGSYVADENGDEPDGADECLVPVDYETDGMLKDDRLAELYAKIPSGSNLTLLMDCCHSGTNQKDLRENVDIVYRFLPTSDEEESKIENARQKFEADQEQWMLSKLRGVRNLSEEEMEKQVRGLLQSFRIKRGRFGDVNNREGNILVAGCKNTQTSADAFIAGGYHGAFTYYLVNAIKSLGSGATYRQAASTLGASLRTNGYLQVPQLEGKTNNKDLALFAPFAS